MTRLPVNNSRNVKLVFGSQHGHGCRQGQDVAPARVIVFCADEDAAKRAAMPLRSGLWGEHTVSVLLPHGEEPIQVIMLLTCTSSHSSSLKTWISELAVAPACSINISYTLQEPTVYTPSDDVLLMRTTALAESVTNTV